MAEILNRQGRRKAQYLVNAVLCYENGIESTPQIHTIEAIVNQILEGKTRLDYPPEKAPIAVPEMEVRSEKIIFSDTVEELREDGFNAIIDTIATFRSK